jgi:competence protein ComFC
MHIRQNFKRLGGAFLDLVFPVSCLVCWREGSYLCETCQIKLPRLTNQQCLVCQKPSPFGKTHPDCVTKNSVDGAIAALTHKDPKVQEIIRAFKYNFVSSLSAPLAELIVQTINQQGLQNYFQNFIIVPVPLHNRRFNWRGFNQAALLSKSLSDNLGIIMDNNLIKRIKFTQPQVRLNAQDRKKNLENAFELSGDPVSKKILLVDDVVTSGSTANELAKLLKKAYASEVWIATAVHG